MFYAHIFHIDIDFFFFLLFLCVSHVERIESFEGTSIWFEIDNKNKLSVCTLLCSFMLYFYCGDNVNTAAAPHMSTKTFRIKLHFLHCPPLTIRSPVWWYAFVSVYNSHSHLFFTFHYIAQCSSRGYLFFLIQVNVILTVYLWQKKKTIAKITWEFSFLLLMRI